MLTSGIEPREERAEVQGKRLKGKEESRDENSNSKSKKRKKEKTDEDRPFSQSQRKPGGVVILTTRKSAKKAVAHIALK